MHLGREPAWPSRGPGRQLGLVYRILNAGRLETRACGPPLDGGAPRDGEAWEAVAVGYNVRDAHPPGDDDVCPLVVDRQAPWVIERGESNARQPCLHVSIHLVETLLEKVDPDLTALGRGRRQDADNASGHDRHVVNQHVDGDVIRRRPKGRLGFGSSVFEKRHDGLTHTMGVDDHVCIRRVGESQDLVRGHVDPKGRLGQATQERPLTVGRMNPVHDLVVGDADVFCADLELECPAPPQEGLMVWL